MERVMMPVMRVRNFGVGSLVCVVRVGGGVGGQRRNLKNGSPLRLAFGAAALPAVASPHYCRSARGGRTIVVRSVLLGGWREAHVLGEFRESTTKKLRFGK